MSTPATPKSTRIYHITDSALNKVHLVKAQNRAQALNCVAANRFQVDIASQEQLINAVSAGVLPVDATAVEAESDDEAKGPALVAVGE